MDKTIDASKAIAFVNAVEKISNPLNLIRTKYFAYSRLYKDGTRIFLNNHKNWLRAYHYDYYNEVPSNGLSDHYHQGIFPTRCLNCSTIFVPAINSYDIGAPIFYILQHPTYCEILIFAGSPEDHEYIEFSLQNFHLFQHFRKYFLQKASNIIETAQSDRMILPHQRNLASNRQHISNQLYNFDHFLNATNLAGDLLGKSSKVQMLTRREIDCAREILQGKSAKKIAVAMQISYRTVEKYCDSLRRKLGCKTKCELIKILSQFDYLIQ